MMRREVRAKKIDHYDYYMERRKMVNEEGEKGKRRNPFNPLARIIRPFESRVV